MWLVQFHFLTELEARAFAGWLSRTSPEVPMPTIIQEAECSDPVKQQATGANESQLELPLQS